MNAPCSYLCWLSLWKAGNERRSDNAGPTISLGVISTLTHELEPLARNGKAFIKTTGFDAQTFNYILERFEPRWNATPVPMPDVNDVGDPRLDRRSLSPAAALSLMLHYLCSSMPEHSL
ncbi:hypothetical protein F441_20992 [Phytophthora nicotianae CJ01A1]|uniref:Uncharacterized protein n=1 Tax=Phytophthora nicotianae CJ01A1 TaxID=1317063 RepID=W2VU80_PHYNI|nr:hypothetical protein F441_20992 [Phytophthora nicotianae CJ01A1]